jgi:hypothetical protein
MERMGMAHERGMCGMRRTGIEERLQLPRGPGKKEALDLTGH